MSDWKQETDLHIELERRRRYHDVVCLVLERLVEVAAVKTKPELEQLADCAKAAAERIYPPPKPRGGQG